jgi:hypothetical protein
MSNDCPLLRELDAWFSLSLDLLASEPGVRRDVLLLLGGAARVVDVAHVTAADCEAVADYLLVYPPNAGGLSLPLTPGFTEATGLHPGMWPAHRADPAADAAAVERAVAVVDAALTRLTGFVRPAGADRLRSLRMHAWRHELGNHVGVLARCYGAEIGDLLAGSGSCPGTRNDRDVANLIPLQRQVTPAVAVA